MILGLADFENHPKKTKAMSRGKPEEFKINNETKCLNDFIFLGSTIDQDEVWATENESVSDHHIFT